MSLMTVNFIGTVILVLLMIAQLIATRLITGKIKNHFDKKIEAYKHLLKQSESNIEFFRKIIITFFSQNTSGKNERKIQALDDIWASLNHIEKYLYILNSLEQLNEKKLLEHKSDPRIQELLNTLAKKIDVNTISDIEILANGSMPWVSEMTWLLYRTCRTIIFHGIARLLIIQSGKDPEIYVKKVEYDKLIIKILKLKSKEIKALTLSEYFTILKKLLLTEIKGDLTFKKSLDDGEDIDHILKHMDKLQEKESKKINQIL